MEQRSISRNIDFSFLRTQVRLSVQIYKIGVSRYLKQNLIFYIFVSPQSRFFTFNKRHGLVISRYAQRAGGPRLDYRPGQVHFCQGLNMLWFKCNGIPDAREIVMVSYNCKSFIISNKIISSLDNYVNYHLRITTFIVKLSCYFSYRNCYINFKSNTII